MVEGWRSGFLLRCRHAGVPDLKFDCVLGLLPRPDSFIGNDYVFDELLWRFKRLHINDGTASSSGKEVFCPFSFGG